MERKGSMGPVASDLLSSKQPSEGKFQVLGLEARTEAPVASLQERRVQLPVPGEGHHELRLAWQTASVCERAKSQCIADRRCPLTCQLLFLGMAGTWS